MKKNKIIIIILLIFWLSFWVFFYNSYINIQKKEKEIEERKKQEELLNKEIEEKLEDFELIPLIEKEKEVIIEEKNENSWRKTLQDNLKQESIDILTFTNIKQCDGLKYLKEKCRNNFLYSLAIENNDLNYCNQLKNKNEVESCKDEINYNKLNCNSIKNTFLKEKCLYNLNQKKESKIVKTASSIDICKILTSYNDKENCAKKIILEKKDLSLCNEISTDKNEQNNCIKNISYELNRFIIQEAVKTKDLSLCDKIIDENIKTQCKSMTF